MIYLQWIANVAEEMKILSHKIEDNHAYFFIGTEECPSSGFEILSGRHGVSFLGNYGGFVSLEKKSWSWLLGLVKQHTDGSFFIEDPSYLSGKFLERNKLDYEAMAEFVAERFKDQKGYANLDKAKRELDRAYRMRFTYDSDYEHLIESYQWLSNIPPDAYLESIPECVDEALDYDGYFYKYDDNQMNRLCFQTVQFYKAFDALSKDS